ncbi:MAG TPA: GTPase domain-containing protein, partial [Candidatus Eisenbacteria bacterium]|nr:GTPase domain-containing protein [Candidatus Eisenbacteria bacterium]
MVVVSYSGKEINAKLVYYGCGLCGKTTNLESIYEAVPDTSRGKMVSMKTQSDRTLFFDLLPLDLGEIMGFKTRFLLYTVPGQVFYNATRKLVLKGADAIVFVADSEVGKMEENRESLENLRTNLAEYRVNLDEMPWLIQYNKRDLPNVYSIEEMQAALNPGAKVPYFEAVATQGKGVFETFRGISHMLMEKVTKELRRGSSPTSPMRPAAMLESPAAPR